MSKPWLSTAVLDKLSRQIGGAVRKAQRALEHATGGRPFREIFVTADTLLVQIKNAINTLEHSDNGCCDDPVTSEHSSDGQVLALQAFDEAARG